MVPHAITVGLLCLMLPHLHSQHMSRASQSGAAAGRLPDTVAASAACGRQSRRRGGSPGRVWVPGQRHPAVVQPLRRRVAAFADAPPPAARDAAQPQRAAARHCGAHGEIQSYPQAPNGHLHLTMNPRKGSDTFFMGLVSNANTV